MYARCLRSVPQENNFSRKLNGNFHAHCLASADHRFGCACLLGVLHPGPSLFKTISRLRLKWLGRGAEWLGWRAGGGDT
jgi:hypothetical protein